MKSRESAFFYGHPQNRFWRLLSELLSEEMPQTVPEKSDFLHRNHIAAWDTIKSCEIIGSSDSSIRNVIPNDLTEILETAPIREIYCNGAKSYEYYHKYIEKKIGRTAIKLPSTSPANAAFSVERLKASWKRILEPLGVAPAGIGEVLLSWYDYNARILPWRSDPTPYHVWVSEIMLQQTRVEAVKAYYARWMEELPDVAALARVSDEQLMKLWEGLGYYNRARNLKAAAKTVMEEFGGALPTDYDRLRALKGIGDYTAGAIASIAFGLPYPAVDGNAFRIFARLLAEEEPVDKMPTKRRITAEIRRILPRERAGDFNQALMDLGTAVCIPNGEPLCEKCPWETVCQAHALQREQDFPVRAPKRKRRMEKKTILRIETEEGIVLHKRPKEGLLAGLWEFPNVEGKLSETQLKKQLQEWQDRGGMQEVSFSGDFQIESLGESRHIFSHVEWQMCGYRIRLQRLAETLLEEKDWVLATKEEVAGRYAIPSAFSYYVDTHVAE